MQLFSPQKDGRSIASIFIEAPAPGEEMIGTADESAAKIAEEQAGDANKAAEDDPQVEPLEEWRRSQTVAPPAVESTPTPYIPKTAKAPEGPPVKFIRLAQSGDWDRLIANKHVAVLFCDAPKVYPGGACKDYVINFTKAMVNFTGQSFVFVYVDTSQEKLRGLADDEDGAAGAELPAIKFFPKGRPQEATLFNNSYKCANKALPECKLDQRWERMYASVGGYVGYHELAISEWFAWQLSNEHLAKYHDIHKGQRCVIIGNGPSLNKMNLTFLNNEISFAVNKIYLGLQRFGFTPTYYNVQNKIVLEQVQDILFGELPQLPKFLNLVGWPMYKLNADDHKLLYLKTDIRKPQEPCVDPRKFCSEGATVTVGNLNLAYWMGCQHVILIGVDHNFIQRKNAENVEEVSQSDDPNHFDPNYFGKGVKWNLADLKTSELSYRYLWRELYFKNGRLITDATVNGKCSIFPRKDYRELFYPEEWAAVQAQENANPNADNANSEGNNSDNSESNSEGSNGNSDDSNSNSDNNNNSNQS